MSSKEEQLKQLIKDGRKIEAIKMLREHDGLGLKESKERVEALQALMVQSGEMEASRIGGGCAGMLIFIMCGFYFLAF